jgi:hypothetical protein
MQSELLKHAEHITHLWPVNLAADDKTDFETELAYQTYDVQLRFYKNAWVSPDSVIYKNGLLVKDTVAANTYLPYYQWRHYIKKIVKDKKIRLDDTYTYLLATDSWSGGHFHWFTEVLPKLSCLGSKSAELCLLLPDTVYMREIAVPSLQQTGIDFAAIHFMQVDSFYKATQLYYITRVSRTGQMSPSVMQQIQKKFTTGKGTRKIYISRDNAACRKVTNESAFATMLQRYDIETVFAEKLSFSDQVNLFTSANLLIGVHGAGLTNCLFMNQGSKVIELRKKENQGSNVGYWHLADSLGHSYGYFNGIPDSDKPLVGRDACNLFIDIELFEKQLSTLLS